MAIFPPRILGLLEMKRFIHHTAYRHVDTTIRTEPDVRASSRVLDGRIPADFVPLEPSSRPFILSPGDHLNANTRFNLSSVSISCLCRPVTLFTYNCG